MPAPKQAKENTTRGRMVSLGQVPAGQVVVLADGAAGGQGARPVLAQQRSGEVAATGLPPTPWRPVNRMSGASGPHTTSSSGPAGVPADIRPDLPGGRGCSRSSALSGATSREALSAVAVSPGAG